MPRSTTLSRQNSSRCGNKACKLGTLTCTSQSIVDQDAVTILSPGHLSKGIIGEAKASRQLKRTRQGAFRLGGKLRFVSPDEDCGQHERDQQAHRAEEDRGACKLLHLPSKEISRYPEERGPGTGADDVGHHEGIARHAIGSGKDAGERAQNRNELGDDNDFAAVAQKQVLAELNPRFGDANVAAVTKQQPVAEVAANG